MMDHYQTAWRSFNDHKGDNNGHLSVLAEQSALCLLAGLAATALNKGAVRDVRVALPSTLVPLLLPRLHLEQNKMNYSFLYHELGK